MNDRINGNKGDEKKLKVKERNVWQFVRREK